MDKLLYIEPKLPRDPEPIVDRLTRLMTAEFRRGVPVTRWRGRHNCVCGARSQNVDYELPSGMVTNSLCVHYMACHRPEVPAEAIRAVVDFACGEEEPTAFEINGR